MRDTMEIQLTTVPPVPETLQQRLSAAAHEAAETVRQWFGCSVDRIEIEVYTSRELWMEMHTRLNEKELATWVAGDAGRIIRVVQTGSQHHLEQMIGHECVHFILGRWAGPIPAWLDEGLAIYLLLGMVDRYRQELEQAAAHEALIPYELLERPFTVLDRELQPLAYAQGCAMAAHLAAEYGRRRLGQLLRSLGRGQSMDQALRSLGVNMYLLERDMLRCLKHRQGAFSEPGTTEKATTETTVKNV